nr:MAG: hypothetical protein DIU78_01405 [Pseudomonadota bacterium]
MGGAAQGEGGEAGASGSTDLDGIEVATLEAQAAVQGGIIRIGLQTGTVYYDDVSVTTLP